MTILLKYLKRIYWFIINKNPMDPADHIIYYQIEIKTKLINRNCYIYGLRLSNTLFRVKNIIRYIK